MPSPKTARCSAATATEENPESDCEKSAIRSIREIRGEINSFD